MKKFLISGILLLHAMFFLILGIASLYESKKMERYIEVPAYISDVHRVSRRIGKSSTSEYEFTINYYYNGEEYSKRSNDSIPPDTLSNVWMDPQTMNISRGGKEEFYISGWVFIGLACLFVIDSIVVFIIFAIMEHKNKTKCYSNPYMRMKRA